MKLPNKDELLAYAIGVFAVVFMVLAIGYNIWREWLILRSFWH